MIIRKAFLFRLKPKGGQFKDFDNFSGACRYIYNLGLEERKRAYEQDQKNLSYFQQNIALTKLKTQEKTSWLKEIHSQVLQQSLKDLDWRQFLTYLKYKAYEKGKHYVEAGKYFPSTQLCSSCGHRQKMGLREREFYCGNCHLKIDRDYNSAISIKAAGMTVLNACGAT